MEPDRLLFADVILPLAVPGVFTYALGEEHSRAQPGMRAVVPFGRGRKLYAGIIRRVHGEPPALRNVRPVLSLLDEDPVANERQLAFWDRVADHYLCTLGEVMLGALPGQLVLSSETRLVASTSASIAPRSQGREAILLDALEEQHVITLAQAGELLGLKDPLPVVKRLMDQGQLMMAEEVQEKYRPRMEQYVRLASETTDESALHAWFDRLQRAEKQLHLLMRFVELSRCLSPDPREVKRNMLLRSAGASPAILKQLCEKGVLEIYQRPLGAPSATASQAAALVLSEAQSATLATLREALQDHEVALLRGVTASGKTELYTTLIGDTLQLGDQVLYLLPEIALTAQAIARMKARFGDRVAVFHSRLSPRDRAELWWRILREPQVHPVLIGARSAIFLPFTSLGLVIVDEEHDPSYKQQDPAPRYHARDMAVVLAGIHGARVLLGSATPSMESQHNAHTGKYGFAELLVRYGEAPLPEVVRVDLREAQRRKQMRGHFSPPLLAAIEGAVLRHDQAIIFQNRRGYVPVWQCETCGWIPECEHCDVSLTYHKQRHGLRCHYCGREYTPPTACRSCGSSRLRMLGLGTEKVEEELQLIFPDLRILRMDQDTTRGKQAFDRILTQFAEGSADVLVGTQMVTKGLDFDQVSVVGILNADQLMRFPDFRAHERAFQLMAQVAGRSGRRRDSGTVYLQAQDVQHPVIGLVMQHDAEGFYRRELEHRRAHGYPPFTRLVRITFKHRIEERVVKTADALAAMVKPVLGERLLGPEAPSVARVRDKHLRHLMIKMAKGRYREEKELLRAAIDRLFAMPEHSPIQLVVDVDPM